MKRVRVIATGGTIASKHDASLGGAVPAMTGQDLVAAVPGIERVAQIEAEQFSNVASQALTFDMALSLSKRIAEVARSGQADGVVVTMGTNTLAEYAYFLDLVLDLPVPVVTVGAMRNPSLVSSDGPRNLLDAVITAASEEARLRGVLLCMNGELHEPRDVMKTETQSVATFQSPGLGPLALVRNGRVVFYRLPAFKEKVPVERVNARVEVVSALESGDGKLVDAAVEYCKADGVVIATMGAGHVPPLMMPAIERAIAKGIPIVLSTRALSGNLLEDAYGYPGGDVHLRKVGAIQGGSLLPPKARIKLTLVLSRTRNMDEVRRYFRNV